MCPPRTPILAVYGDRFSGWLQEQAWVRDVPYIPDVARIDRLYVESLFAADAESMELGAISGRDDWLEMRLTLHPATRFTWLSMPAMTIWLAQREEEGEIEPDWRAEGVLLTRPALAVQPLRLDAARHRFLSGIRLGDTVGDAAITTVSLYPETDIGSLFTSLVNAGAFAASSNRSLP